MVPNGTRVGSVLSCSRIVDRLIGVSTIGLSLRERNFCF